MDSTGSPTGTTVRAINFKLNLNLNLPDSENKATSIQADTQAGTHRHGPANLKAPAEIA